MHHMCTQGCVIDYTCCFFFFLSIHYYTRFLQNKVLLRSCHLRLVYTTHRWWQMVLMYVLTVCISVYTVLYLRNIFSMAQVNMDPASVYSISIPFYIISLSEYIFYFTLFYLYRLYRFIISFLLVGYLML